MEVLLDKKRSTEKLEHDIRRQIEFSVLKKGDRILPKRELCAMYGLSQGSVQKVLRNLTSAGLLKTKGRHGTFVHAGTSSFRGKKSVTRTIVFGFLSSIECSDIVSLPYMNDIYRGMESEALKSGWDIAVQLGEVFKNKITLWEKNPWADGIIIDGTGMETVIEPLKKTDIPFVVIDYPTKKQDINCIYSDNITGGYLAVSHLLQMGHREIGFVYPSFRGEAVMQEGFKTRFYGYQDALNERGIEVDRQMVLGVDTGSRFILSEEGEEQLRDYLSGLKRPAAIFTASDSIAPEIYRVAGQAGMQIPGDMSIVGFEGLSLGEALKPELTTVNMNLEQMGRLAVHRLQSIFNGDTEPVSHVLPVQLVVRGSTMKLQQ